MKPPRRLSGWIAACAFALGVSATADESEVVWAGDAPCEDALSYGLTDAVAELPGGARLTEDGLRASTYLLASGSVLVVVQPDIRTHEVYGASYDAAWADMIERRPLQDSIARKTEDFATLASVRNRVALQYLTTPAENGLERVKPGSVTFRLVPRMRLAEWVGYGGATPGDAALWDRKQCEHIHHELGHILIAAQAILEAEDELSNLRATEDEFEDAVADFMDALDARTSARHDDYHALIAEWGEARAHARPYLELPFPWLDGESNSGQLAP